MDAIQENIYTKGRGKQPLLRRKIQHKMKNSCTQKGPVPRRTVQRRPYLLNVMIMKRVHDAVTMLKNIM